TKKATYHHIMRSYRNARDDELRAFPQGRITTVAPAKVSASCGSWASRQAKPRPSFWSHQRKGRGCARPRLGSPTQQANAERDSTFRAPELGRRQAKPRSICGVTHRKGWGCVGHTRNSSTRPASAGRGGAFLGRKRPCRGSVTRVILGAKVTARKSTIISRQW